MCLKLEKDSYQFQFEVGSCLNMAWLGFVKSPTFSGCGSSLQNSVSRMLC